MLLHVTFNGKKTTVNIDDELMDLVGALMVKKRPALHGNAKRQMQEAKALARHAVTQFNPITLRACKQTLSKALTNRLVMCVADEALFEIIEKRGPRYDKRTEHAQLIDSIFKTPEERERLTAQARADVQVTNALMERRAPMTPEK